MNWLHHSPSSYACWSCFKCCLCQFLLLLGVLLHYPIQSGRCFFRSAYVLSFLMYKIHLWTLDINFKQMVLMWFLQPKCSCYICSEVVSKYFLGPLHVCIYKSISELRVCQSKDWLTQLQNLFLWPVVQWWTPFTNKEIKKITKYRNF